MGKVTHIYILYRCKGSKFCPKRAIRQAQCASHFVRHMLVLLRFLTWDEIVWTLQPHIYGRVALNMVDCRVTISFSTIAAKLGVVK
jgi:hypothetical protein